jgi:uncharacterized Zn-finger protein
MDNNNLVPSGFDEEVKNQQSLIMDMNPDLDLNVDKLFDLPKVPETSVAQVPTTPGWEAPTVVNAQPSPSQRALHDFYDDKFLDELNWDFNDDNLSAIYNDSTTLPSARTSYEYRTSSEVFDALSQFEDDLPINTTSRFRNSISNSLSSIFKSNNPNRFNLRGMNPLSAHKDVQVVVQALPSLANSIDDLNIYNQDQQETRKQKCDTERNIHIKNCDCRRGKSKTQSLVNALTNARLGFNTKNTTRVPETVEEERMSFEFDEELSRVISLASMNSSTYNFNVDNFGADGFNAADSTTPEDQIMTEQAQQQDDDKKHSPDYAALFSDMSTRKKRSKMFGGSFSKGQSQQKQSDGSQVLPTVPEGSPLTDTISTTSTSASVQEKNDVISSIPATVQNEPPRRGRKPTLEYDPAKQFVCSYCKRRFKRQEHLKRHVRSLHTHERPFDCELCGKKFSRSDNLAQHIKTHYNEDE